MSDQCLSQEDFTPHIVFLKYGSWRAILKELSDSRMSCFPEIISVTEIIFVLYLNDAHLPGSVFHFII